MLKNSTHCQGCLLKERPFLKSDYIADPDILFVGAYPLQLDIEKSAFMGKHSVLLRKVITRMQRERPKAEQIVPDYSYACLCSPEYDKENKKFRINTDILNHCSFHLKVRIDWTKPKVIVALGSDALKAMDFKGKHRDMRGGIYSFKRSDGVSVPVVATFHIVEVSRSPGLLMTFMKDLGKAFVLAKDALQEFRMNIRTPTGVDDICTALDDIMAAARKNRETTGRAMGLAVDTETSSLKPYVKEDRVIAISLSHEAGTGLAYPFQHKGCEFTEEEFARISQKTVELLSHPDVSIIMANGKFDLQWLKFHYGFSIKKLSYDVLLAEHVLDEDKKGEYSLKDVTRDRFPSMGKYEEELKQHLHDVWSAKDEAVARLREEHKQQVSDAIIDWWANINDPEVRLRYLSEWVTAGYMMLSETEGLHEVKYRTLHGKRVIPKKYQKAVSRLVERVPADKLQKVISLPKLVIPAELEVKNYEDADLTTLLRYAAIDALTTRMICSDQARDFQKENDRISRTEQKIGRPLPTRTCSAVMHDNTIPLCQCIAQMEYNGIRLDRERAKEYQAILFEKIKEAEDVMFTEVGRRFNTSSSSPDLGRILFEEFKLPVKKLTDTGAPSTDAETIKELADEYDLPFLEKLLVYRKLDKCLHTYINNWIDMSQYDGHIHAQFNQIGTSTYRLSSSSPNLQNVPFALKEANLNLKALFLPDSEDYDLIDLDASNAEIRILTAYSRDKALIDAFQSGKDLHCLTAAGISQYTYEEIKANKDNKESDHYRKRQLAKKVNFGTVYCMSPERLQQQLWSELRIEESIEQCQEYLNKFFETYPGVKKYIDHTKSFVEDFGYTWTFTGRRRRFAIASFNRAQLSRMGRQAVNARIQTTSSDLVTYNLIDVENWAQSVGGRVILTVHDSILFQLPKGITGVRAALDHLIIEKTAERAPWLPVIWKYDAGKGPNYGDTHGEID